MKFNCICAFVVVIVVVVVVVVVVAGYISLLRGIVMVWTIIV
jgi:hypothetical protein